MFVSSGVRNTRKYFNPVYKALCLCPQSDWLEGILLNALRDYDASSQTVACLEYYTHCQVGTSSRCHLLHTFSASYVRKERDPAEGLEQRHLCPLPQTASLAWWLRRPPRERKVPGSNPVGAGIFSGSSHTSDLKIGTPVATLPGAWRYRVRAGTGRPGVSIL